MLSKMIALIYILPTVAPLLNKVIIISKNPFYLGMKLYSTLAVLLCLLSHDVHTFFDHSRPPNYLSHLTLSQGPWLHWQYLLTYLVAHYFKAILTSFARCVATLQSLRTLDYRCPWGLLCSRGERPSSVLLGGKTVAEQRCCFPHFKVPSHLTVGREAETVVLSSQRRTHAHAHTQAPYFGVNEHK